MNEFSSDKINQIKNQVADEIKNILANLENDYPSVTEGLATAIGAGTGAAGSLVALSTLGVSGLSAAGISSGLAAAGSIIGGGMVAGIGVLAAPIAALGITGYYFANRSRKAEVAVALGVAIGKLYDIQTRLLENAEYFKDEIAEIKALVAFLSAKQQKTASTAADDSLQTEIKAVKLLQDRTDIIENSHKEIDADLDELKITLADAVQTDQHTGPTHARPLARTDLQIIYSEAESKYVKPLTLSDILSITDFAEAEKRMHSHVRAFNKQYDLDGWDYAIAGSCGLFAAMLDILFVKSPSKPTAAWTQRADGIFNRRVQKAFNSVITPELSEALRIQFFIGAPDMSVGNSLNPTTHRLRSLAHDPVLGLIFGVLDMIRGTCTAVVDGELVSIPSEKGPTDGNVFQLFGRMFGHLLSDVNAPSAKGNRGMGLPAPFMGLLLMFEKMPLCDYNFGKQIELMYIHGYDFRQFTATSIPMFIMEILIRAFHAVKQTQVNGVLFEDAMLDTMPFRMTPRFRVMLALAYGTSSSVNAGKMYVTKDVMGASWASWMGLTWNGFQALKWALIDKNLKFLNELDEKEILELECLVIKLDELEGRSTQLPT